MRGQQTRDYEWMELLYYHYHRNIIWLHLSAAKTSNIRAARATRTPSERDLPRSPRKIHNPALKMREYSRRAFWRLFQASDRSPPRPAAQSVQRERARPPLHGAPRDIQQLWRKRTEHVCKNVPVQKYISARVSSAIRALVHCLAAVVMGDAAARRCYCHYGYIYASSWKTVRMRACVQARPEMIKGTQSMMPI